MARGEYAIPLATTEAALVASYHRGARVITAAGGCRALVAAESLSRAPAFAFANLVEVRQFLDWLDGVRGCLTEVAATSTRHGRLIGVRPVVEGNHVYLDCEFTTGNAAGQNMVTLATEAIVAFILSAAPVKPRYHILEGNLSGDKKLCARSLAHVRGRRGLKRHRRFSGPVRERPRRLVSRLRPGCRLRRRVIGRDHADGIRSW